MKKKISLENQILIAKDFSSGLAEGTLLLKILLNLKKRYTSYASQINQMYNSIREGNSVSGSMDKKYFNQFLIAMVEAGEETGTLDETLMKAAEALELQSKVEKHKPAYSAEILFYTQLANLASSIPIIRALAIMQEFDYLPKDWRKAISEVSDDIDRNIPLPQAMSKHKVFKKEDINVIAGGLKFLVEKLVPFYKNQFEMEYGERKA